MGSDATHWERVYQTKNFDSVSWYTPHLKTSLSIINELKSDKAKSLIDIGGGESTEITFSTEKLKSGGDYSFFCSFPGHWAIMKGKFKFT